jgi:hypothetical protein
LVLAIATTAAPNVVWAQSSREVSTTAREVAKRGLADFAGDHEATAQKLLQASEVVKVPTLAVYVIGRFRLRQPVGK